MADQAEAWSVQKQGNRGRAAELHRRALARASELGARFFIHMSVAGLGTTAGDPPEDGATPARDLATLVDAVLEELDTILTNAAV